jgi:hypothetical protein
MSKLHRHLHRLAGRPREPRPKAAVHTAVDKTTPVVMPPVRERWDVVMLSPAANEGTLSRINAAGFDVWRPRAVVLVSSATLGKAAWMNRPLWPRYAFVGRRDGCPSLADVPFIGPVQTIGQIDGQVVCDVAAREWRGEYDLRRRQVQPKVFEPGTRVQTLDDLMEGIVLRSEGERVTLLCQFLGSVREAEAYAGHLREMA